MLRCVELDGTVMLTSISYIISRYGVEFTRKRKLARCASSRFDYLLINVYTFPLIKVPNILQLSVLRAYYSSVQQRLHLIHLTHRRSGELDRRVSLESGG